MNKNTFWGFINHDIFVKYCLNISVAKAIEVYTITASMTKYTI